MEDDGKFATSANALQQSATDRHETWFNGNFTFVI